MSPSSARAPERRPDRGAGAALRRAGPSLLGIVTQSAPIAPMDLVRGEKSLIGSLVACLGRGLPGWRCGCWAAGAVQAAPLITDRIPLSAAVSGGLALLRDEPDRHLKILVGGSRMSAADAAACCRIWSTSQLYAAVVSDILDDLGHRDHALDPAIRPARAR